MEDSGIEHALQGVGDSRGPELEQLQGSDLSKDLLLILFQGLGLHELAVVLLVSRTWRAAALDPALPAWSALSVDTFLILCPTPQDAADEHRGPPLTESRKHFSRVSVERACSRCPNLRHLDVSSLARVDDALLATVGLRCPELKSLKLHDSCSLSSSVSSRGVIHLATLCPALTTLDISFTEVSDRGIAALAQLTHLKTLRLHNSTRITGSSLPQLVAKCPELEQVRLAPRSLHWCERHRLACV